MANDDTVNGDGAIEQSPQYRQAPSSSGIDEMLTLLVFADYLEGGMRETGRKLRTSSRVKYWIRPGETPGDIIVEFKSKAGKIQFELPNVAQFRGNNKGLTKLFIFITQTIREQAAHSGALIAGAITFPVERLIELGMYSTIQSARVALKRAVGLLRRIGLRGQFKYAGSNKIDVDAQQSLFTGVVDFKRSGMCAVSLNKEAPWPALLAQNTMLPDYLYGLNFKPMLLLYFILNMARQLLGGIVTSGSFTVKMNTVRNRLCLPNPDATQKPQRDIVEVIRKAVDEINATQGKVFHNADIFLTLEHSTPGRTLDGRRVNEFLAMGLLRVTIRGQLRDDLIKVSGIKRLADELKAVTANATEMEQACDI